MTVTGRARLARDSVAVSFLHRSGSALNHHVHLHACATDGVFVPTGNGPAAFLPARPRKHRHRYHGVFAPNHKGQVRSHGA